MDKIVQMFWNVCRKETYRFLSSCSYHHNRLFVSKQEGRGAIPVHKLRSHSFLIYKIVKLISFKATRTSFPREYH